MTGTESTSSEKSLMLSLSKDNFLDFSETTDTFEKALENIRVVMDCRADIFMQKKEKQKLILDHQMMKLESERNDYMKKSEILMKNIGECKSQLMKIEHSCFDIRNKLETEKQTNKVLKEKINRILLESEEKNGKFNKTCELYKKVIGWYNSYLNIVINLDKENLNVITVTFKGYHKYQENFPYIKLLKLESYRFEVVDTHPKVENGKLNLNKIIERHEVILFVNEFRNYLKESC